MRLGLGPNFVGYLKRLGNSVSAKLILLLISVMLVVFALLGGLNIRLHRQHLEAATLQSAERVSDVIKRSTSYYMLRNDREGLYHIIQTTANEPGMTRIRIFNQQGRISFSTDLKEVNTYVDKSAESCYACHAQAQPLERLKRPDRFRIYPDSGGGRVLAIINPIENQPACYTADCHAHPAEQKILGVLDTSLSLQRGDASLAQGSREMFLYTVVAVAIISLLTGLFVWRIVRDPLALLRAGTEKLAAGGLGYQIHFKSQDELGELAASFNRMSYELWEANKEITAWNRSLEARVEQKTRELKRIHNQMLQVEKMASVGKLAAIVAHEINNPLAGILTYSKLLKKWLIAPEAASDLAPERREQIRSSLDLIEAESRRCGEIVKNLLVFSRTAPMNLEWADLNAVIGRCARLVEHQAEASGIQVQLHLNADLPSTRCDPSQVQQVLLALLMNALDATASGGCVRLSSTYRAATQEVVLQVQDDGAGIPSDVMTKLFEPFFTTKEAGRGVGLGLAISQGIVERHNGRIEVQSVPGRGSTFTVILPQDANAAPQAAPEKTAETAVAR